MVSPLPGRPPAQTGVAFVKAALRLVGGSDLADAISDLTGLGRADVETLAARAASFVSEHASEEFRHIGDADREWAEGVVSRCYQQLASDPEQRIVRESVVGPAQLSSLALEGMSAADKATAEQASEDVRAYLNTFSETIATLVTQWYESDREANRIATSRAAGETLERVRRLPDELSDGLQEYVDQRLLPQISAIAEIWHNHAHNPQLREPALLTVEEVRSGRLDSNYLLNDIGEKAGRLTETAAIETAVDRSTDWPLVVLVSGRGGIGKSRLLVEILSDFQSQHAEVPVRWVAPGRLIDSLVLNELPDGPAVVVVDDAHRRTGQLRPLLEYAKHGSDIQLILATRGPGLSSIQAELVEADVRTGQVEEIPIEELNKSEGRALVDSLLDGLDVRFEFREFLSSQAQRSPFLAVLTANLLRAGELTEPLALDASLRKQVMVRYWDVVSDGIASDSQPAVHRLLAVIAALSVVDLTDPAFLTLVEAVSGLSRPALLRATRDLREHGVLIGDANATQFAVEMLGDQLLEEEAIIDGVDSGFVGTLWSTFKQTHRKSVLSGIGSLAWRLGDTGQDLVRDIWIELRGEVAGLDLDGLRLVVGQLRDVTFTQANDVVQLSKTILARLEQLADEPRPPTVNDEVNPFSWLRETTPADIRRTLGPTLADAAVYDPTLLEDVLDMLWALSLHDERSLPQNPDHPSRLVADRLGNIGALPDPSFPERIARRVQAYVHDNAHASARSPLELLKSLLVKDGTTTEMADRRTVQFKPFLVNADWARPVRDVACSILLEAAADDSGHVAEALRILGEALMPPAGYFGAAVPDDVESAWDDDNLATLSVLARVADRTSRSSVRRLVRQEAEWTAQYSSRPVVRLSALALLTRLDEREEDDVAEYLRSPGLHLGIPSRRGMGPPTLEDIEADIRNEAEGDRDDDFDEKYAALMAAQAEATNAVATELWQGDSVDSGVSRLDANARDLSSLGVDVAETVHTLFASVASSHPAAIPSIFRSVLSLPPGPLDEALPQLLEGIRTLDDPAFSALIAEYETLEARLRGALGLAAARYGWLIHGSPFVVLTAQGRVDNDPKVRGNFLTTLRLDLEPEASADFLRASEVETSTVDSIIRSTMHHAPPGWSAQLTDGQLHAILEVLDSAGGSHAASALLATLASDHPTAILMHLQTQVSSGTAPFRNRDGRVAEALNRSPQEVAGWILDVSRTPDAIRIIRQLHPPLPEVLSSEVSDALANSIADADVDAETVVGLASALTGLNGWVPFAPALARLLLECTSLTEQQRESVLQALQVQLTPGHWSGSGGRSSQLESAREAAAAAEAVEPNPVLRQLLELAVDELDSRIDNFQLEDDVDD